MKLERSMYMKKYEVPEMEIIEIEDVVSSDEGDNTLSELMPL